MYHLYPRPVGLRKRMCHESDESRGRSIIQILADAVALSNPFTRLEPGLATPEQRQIDDHPRLLPPYGSLNVVRPSSPIFWLFYIIV